MQLRLDMLLMASAQTLVMLHNRCCNKFVVLDILVF